VKALLSKVQVSDMWLVGIVSQVLSPRGRINKLVCGSESLVSGSRVMPFGCSRYFAASSRERRSGTLNCLRSDFSGRSLERYHAFMSCGKVWSLNSPLVSTHVPDIRALAECTF
jgi:hypothetical protein